MKVAFAGGQNPFWKQTLTAWKKLLKNTADGSQDRTTGTTSRILHSLLDLEQGGNGFHTTDPHLTVEVLFKTCIEDNGKLTAEFRPWEDISKVLEKERHFNHIVYKRIRKTYRYLLHLIEAEGNSINETLPASPHWSYSLLRVGRKGCRDLKNSSVARETLTIANGST